MSRGSRHVPRMRPLPTRRPAIVSVLDIGSSKVACVIARLKPREPDEVLPGRTHKIEVVGFGYTRSRGIKSGVIINLDQAEQAVRIAVDMAERAAGITIESVIVNVSCGRLRSETFAASVGINGSVSETDVQRVLAAGSLHTVTADRTIVHSLPIGYALDKNRGIRDPLGMLGERLGVDMHVVTAETAPLSNLELCIERCHIDVETVVATPYASGLSTLVDDEAELGVACIDMGGGTTTVSVFVDGAFVHADAVALGGQHVTKDIANALSTRFDDAERLKTFYGSALPSTADERDVITVPPVSEDERDTPNHVPRAVLTRIIRPRVEEILELVRDRLNASGFAAHVGQRIVITGGASQLTGLAEVARRVLARNVRLGRPLGVAGLPEVAKAPSFAAVIGLLIYPQVARIEQFETRRSGLLKTGTGGYLARMGQWFRESF